MKRIVLALIAIAVTPLALYAGGCVVRRVTYAQPYVAPVRAYVHRAKVIVQQVEVNRDHYYSIDNSYAQSLLADAIVGRLLRSGLVKDNTGTGRSPTGPVTRPSATGDGDKPATQEIKAGPYQNADLVKVVSDSCVKCHGESSKYSKLLTADGKLTDQPAGKIWECFGLVNSGEMPKGGKSLPDDQVKLFYDWAKNSRK